MGVSGFISRSDLVTKEIAKAFGTVIKSNGFPKNYAETFATNILFIQSKVKTVLDINIHGHTLEKGVKDGSEPVYRNPALFLFVCIVFDDIQFPVDVAEVYFRVVRFLYQKYSQEGTFFSPNNDEYENEFSAWMTAFGKETMNMLKQGPNKIIRHKSVKSIGCKVYHWLIFTDHMYRFPTRNMSDDIHLIFPCFAIQEFFAAYYYNKYVKQEEQGETKTHFVFVEALSRPREVLNMSNMFQICFNWLNREWEKIH